MFSSPPSVFDGTSRRWWFVGHRESLTQQVNIHKNEREYCWHLSSSPAAPPSPLAAPAATLGGSNCRWEPDLSSGAQGSRPPSKVPKSGRFPSAPSFVEPSSPWATGRAMSAVADRGNQGIRRTRGQYSQMSKNSVVTRVVASAAWGRGEEPCRRGSPTGWCVARDAGSLIGLPMSRPNCHRRSKKRPQ